MYKKTCYSKNGYLSNLDLINKYNFKSVYSVPKLQTISLTISLNSIIEACDFKSLSIKDHEIQIKTFILFYITFLIVPFLKNNKIKLVKSVEKSLSMNYILKIVLVNSIDINEFLFLIFIENWQQVLIEDQQLFKKKSAAITLANFITFRTSINLNNLLSFQSIFSMLFSNINLKEVPLKISFSLRMCKNLKSTNKFKVLNNLPLFWISG